MVQFLRRSESRGIVIAWVNSIRITKSINLLLILFGVGVRCDLDIVKLTARVQSIFRKVDGSRYPYMQDLYEIIWKLVWTFIWGIF